MSYRILIVDDSILTRTAIRRIIKMIDIDVGELYEACNGAEALDLLDRCEIDLVLADLNMPGMGGVELVHRMKEREQLARVPVIVISTDASATRLSQLLADGIRDYLHKPFTPEEFRNMLARNLGVSAHEHSKR